MVAAKDIIEHERTVGDTLTPIGATLVQRDSSNELAVVDMTNRSAKFTMVSLAGETIVDNADASVVSPGSNGQVQYDFAASEVAIGGIYYGWFRGYDEQGVEFDTFPAGGRIYRIMIHEVG